MRGVHELWPDSKTKSGLLVHSKEKPRPVEFLDSYGTRLLPEVIARDPDKGFRRF